MILTGLSLLAILGTWIPQWDKSYWLVRGQDYFKSFYLVVNLFLVLLILFASPMSWWYIFLGLALFISAIYCGMLLLPYTKIWHSPVPKANGKEENSLNILIYNVWQDNDNYSEAMQMIKEVNPDILLLLETDEKWEQAYSHIDDLFPFKLKEIRNDTYGITLMSKIKPEESEVRFLHAEDTPSVYAKYRIGDENIYLYGIHPKPPIAGESDTSVNKEKEILSIIQDVEERLITDKIILIGDMNDVAWSRTALKLKKETHLNDPREGRGFYSTFPTYSHFRIPIDHVFVSPGFRLQSFDLKESCGSDHFPINVRLAWG